MNRHDEPEETTGANIPSDSNNQESTTVLNTSHDRHVIDGINNLHTSSNSNQSQEKTEVHAFFDDTQTGASVESKPPIQLDKIESNDDVNAASSHSEPEKTEKVTISPNSSEVERMDDSVSYHDQNENGRRKNENTSSDRHCRKKSPKPKITSHVDEPDKLESIEISYSLDEPDLLELVFANATNKNLINRLLGCAYGQALGDAYGLSTEFEDRHDIDHKYLNRSKIIPFPNYVLTGHNRRWTRGDWTDDTDQWILILETLIYQNGDEKVFAKKLTNWIRYGYRELGDHGGMGLGANVSQVISCLSIDLLQLDKREKTVTFK
jgi:hypothetical protein